MAAPEGTRRAWGTLARLFVDDRFFTHVHEAAAAAGLNNPGGLKAMLWLDPDDPPTMRAVAAHLKCDASYVTAMVDDLERLGYVERKVSPTDRRAKLVQLTALGEKARSHALDVLSRPSQQSGSLTLAEAKTFAALMGKLLGD